MARQPFTFYIIAEKNGEHTPCLMSRNGKQALNEPCKRAVDIERTYTRYRQQMAYNASVMNPVRITRADFNKKYPKGPAKNSGPKRKPKTFIALAGKYKGQKVTARATPVELKARKDSRWITNPDGSPGTSLKAHLKPVKSTTKSGKR